MNEMKDVQRRIRQRRHEEPKQHNHIFRFFYHIMMVLMAVGVLGLAYLVNDKIGLVELPQDIKNLNFAKISEWLPFEDWFVSSNDADTVSTTPTYTLLKDHQYTNGSNQANLIQDGVVLHVEEKDGAKSSVTVRNDNGVIVTYGHLNTVQVRQDERLKQGDVAGSFDGYVTLDMVKNNQAVDLETASAK